MPAGDPLIQRFLSRRSEARHALRVAVAAGAAFGFYHLVNLPQGYWAVFSAVIVVQSSIGATLNLSVERMKGTIAGAIVGGIAAWLHPPTPLGLGAAIALSVAITSFGAAARPALKVAPVTAVIMLINPNTGAGGPLETAALRVLEIGVGSLIGLLATLLIFPARAHLAAQAKIRTVLGQMADMIEMCIQRLKGVELDTFAQSGLIRATLAGVEAALAEAARERSSRLGDHLLPEAIGRTLWRVRNDSVVIARIADAGLPPAAEAIRPAAEALLAAEAAFMRACGEALTGAALDRTTIDAAHAGFQAAIETLRRERLTRDLTFEAVSPVFGVVFAAEALYRNLGDLGDRVEEAAGKSPAPPREALA